MVQVVATLLNLIAARLKNLGVPPKRQPLETRQGEILLASVFQGDSRVDKSTDDTSIAGHAFINSTGAKTPQAFTMQLLMPWLTEIPDAAQQAIYMALNLLKLNQSRSPRFRVARTMLCPCVQSPITGFQKLLSPLFVMHFLYHQDHAAACRH